MLTCADIARVLAYYALGEPLRIIAATEGAVNETAFVDTEQGRFVVRRNHWRFNEAALRYRQQLMIWLRERNFPAPAILAARDGDTLLALDRRYYEVFAYVPGAAYDPARPRQLDSVGAMLARYHQLIRDFPAPPGPKPSRCDGRAVQALCERLIERDFLGDLSDQLAWYSARASRLQSLVSAELYASLPALVIHGDIHQANVRFTGDAVAALLDYDQARWDARIIDLAAALIAFATTVEPDDGLGHSSQPLDPERATRLITVYSASVPLLPAELAALPWLVELLWLLRELGRVYETPDAAPDYHCSLLARGERLSHWMDSWGNTLYTRWIAAANIVH